MYCTARCDCCQAQTMRHREHPKAQTSTQAMSCSAPGHTDGGVNPILPRIITPPTLTLTRSAGACCLGKKKQIIGPMPRADRVARIDKGATAAQDSFVQLEASANVG